MTMVSARMMKRTPRSVALHRLVAVGLVAALGACEGELDQRGFARRAERAYIEVHPGWTIIRRREGTTMFARGDQQDTLRISELYLKYKESGQSASVFFSEWTAARQKEAEARRRTLVQAEDDVIPVIKGGDWVRVQDLGAIGPPRIRDKIRPWRKSIANDVFVVLGVPEEQLGYRFVSVEEMGESGREEDEWVTRAVANLMRQLGKTDGRAMYASKDDSKLLVLDMKNEDGVSGLVLDVAFRRRMLERFNLPELGAAVPIRNVLIIFDPADFVTVKPIRARTHQLYDTQNHPGFRGLLRFDKDLVSVLEPANPKRKGQR